MLKTIAINVLELVTAGASTYAGVKFIEHRQNTNEFEDFKADQRKREKQLKDRYTQELGAKEEQMKELEMQLSLFEMDENERIKQFKRLEAEKLQKLAQSIIESHLEASTAKLNNFMASLSDRLIAAEFILADMAIDLNQLENSKKEQRALEDLAVKIVADDVDALGRNYCSMDALKKDFTSLTPLIRQYNIQKESHFSLGTYLCSFLLSKAMFTDVPTNKNDVFHHIKTALDSGQLILALRLYQTLQGWPRMILRDWADRCYTRLECIQEIQGKLYLNKL